MDDEAQIDVPVNHADALRRLAAILRDRDQARQSNDPQQQRALRQLAHERLEQLMNELFPEVYAAVNEAAAVTRDMAEREPDRAGYPLPKHRTYSMPLLRDNPEAAREADAILAHFLTKAAPRLPLGLGEAAAAALWLKQMGEETWLGLRTTPDGGRINFRNRILFGLVHYEWGYNRGRPHLTIDEGADAILAQFPRITMDWKSLERAASKSRGDFVALGQRCEKAGKRDAAAGLGYSPPYAGYRAALLLKAGDFLRRKHRAAKSRK